MEKRLTIGMATYDDYDGVYFTIQALRMFHPYCKTSNVEFIVLDNNPKGTHAPYVRSFVEKTVKGRYIPFDSVSSSFNKYKIVEHSNGKYVLILDCHVLLEQNAVNHLLAYFSEHPDCKNLVQGPLMYDDLSSLSTHFTANWSGDMYGTWAFNREEYTKGLPFEIPMQGMGLCAFERANWPGINSNFKGFGAEEWYIAERFRQNGGQNICLPSLKWNHRFSRPNGVNYPLSLEDRIFNYSLGWMDLYHDENHPLIIGMKTYFNTRLPETRVQAIFNRATELIK